MASYTMELREYIESFSYGQTLSIRDQIEQGRTKLFDFDYEIFDTNYKKVFETHFIRRFYMREIGYETEERFKFELETWLMINMPYFNKLFQSELLTFPVFDNTKLDSTNHKTNDTTTTSTGQTDGTSSSTQDGTSEETSNTTDHETEHQTGSATETGNDFSRKLGSDTPDTRLTITSNNGEGVIEYASNIEEINTNNSKTTSSTGDTTGDKTSDHTASGSTHATGSETTSVTSTGNGTVNEIEDYIESKTGKLGTQTYASMLKEYRDSFLRIENDMFKEMEKRLFMLVY